MKIFDVGIDALEKDMNFRLQRQNLISSNLANINTGGYQAKDINFDEALKEVYKNGEAQEGSSEMNMSRTDGMHLEMNDGRLAGDGDETFVVQAPGIDENGVDLDREMARMAENSVMYSASSTAIRKKLGMLKYAVQEGGR